MFTYIEGLILDSYYISYARFPLSGVYTDSDKDTNNIEITYYNHFEYMVLVYTI